MTSIQMARGVGRSDVGRTRERNEDSFLADDDLGLYVVSDGMGGHAAGEIASALAVESVARVIRGEEALVRSVASGEEKRQRLVELVERAIIEASGAVFAKATGPGGYAGMGCTLTVLVVAGAGGVMGHVGDSRLYLVRGEGVSQVSSDHTVVGEMLRAGLVGEDDIEDSPYAHVLSRAVGTQSAVRVDTLAFDALPGDRYLLCSDGYSNYLTQPASLVTSLQGELEDVADELVASANAAGGSDNITVVVVAVEAEEEDTERITRVEDNYGALGAIFLFEDLSMPLLAHVMAACRSRSHDTGDVVVAAGDECDSLFVVVHGAYELVVDGTVHARLGAGAYTGINLLLEPRAARATLRAAEPSRMLRLRAARFAEVVRERPWFGIALLEQLGRRLSRDLDSVMLGSGVAKGEQL